MFCKLHTKTRRLLTDRFDGVLTLAELLLSLCWWLAIGAGYCVQKLL